MIWIITIRWWSVAEDSPGHLHERVIVAQMSAAATNVEIDWSTFS